MTAKTHTIPGLLSHSGALLRRFFTVKLAVYYSSLRHSADNYRLPLTVTIVFILLISGLAAVRLFEKTSLVGLLPGTSGGGQGYSTLLISDEPDEFTRASTDSDEPETSGNSGTSSGSSNSFSINSDETPSSGGGTSTTPKKKAAVFSASIAYLKLDRVTLECVNPSNPKKGNCSKKYSFKGGVNISNGPGTVRYSWRSNIQEANNSDSFSARTGSSTKVLQQQIILECKRSSDNSLQLILSSPTFTQSPAINFNHNCDEL